MKTIILSLFIVFFNLYQSIGYSQTKNLNNEPVIAVDYYPAKTATVSTESYIKGIKELDYAYYDFKRREASTMDYIDYWRIAVAYSYMGIDKDQIYSILLKSKTNNKKGFCIIFNHFEKDRGYFKSLLGDAYQKLKEDCYGYNITSKKTGPSGKFSLKTNKGVTQWLKKN
ncbi:hypothetical protein [Winogradskyella sp.]|uniref:hypothetical protein n=1 Tax=Winogradskyella sp. TaxID=1883156 RepID=UPI003BA9DDD9